MSALRTKQNIVAKRLSSHVQSEKQPTTALNIMPQVLVPMPSAFWQPIPLFLKRLLFFEFSKYEYRPKQKKGQ